MEGCTEKLSVFWCSRLQLFQLAGFGLLRTSIVLDAYDEEFTELIGDFFHMAIYLHIVLAKEFAELIGDLFHMAIYLHIVLAINSIWASD
jgi:hypothetical protein